MDLIGSLALPDDVSASADEAALADSIGQNASVRAGEGREIVQSPGKWIGQEPSTHKKATPIFPKSRGAWRRQHPQYVKRASLAWSGVEKALPTKHGFRSSFSDWCAETTSFASELREMALAHAIGNKVEAAYRRGDMVAKRRQLMADWAAYCGTLPEERGTVVTFKR